MKAIRVFNGVEEDIEGAQGFAEGPSDVLQRRYALIICFCILILFAYAFDIVCGWCLA